MPSRCSAAAMPNRYMRWRIICSSASTEIVRRLCQTPPKQAFHRMEPVGAERHRREAREGELAGASESNDVQFSTQARDSGISLRSLVIQITHAISISQKMPA